MYLTRSFNDQILPLICFLIWFIYHSSQFVPSRAWPGWLFLSVPPHHGKPAQTSLWWRGSVCGGEFCSNYDISQQDSHEPGLQSWPLSCHQLVSRQLEQSGAVWRLERKSKPALIRISNDFALPGIWLLLFTLQDLYHQNSIIDFSVAVSHDRQILTVMVERHQDTRTVPACLLLQKYPIVTIVNGGENTPQAPLTGWLPGSISVWPTCYIITNWQ